MAVQLLSRTKYEILEVVVVVVVVVEVVVEVVVVVTVIVIVVNKQQFSFGNKTEIIKETQFFLWEPVTGRAAQFCSYCRRFI